jgi:hypothetical protein
MDAWTHNLPVAGPMVSGAVMGDLRVSQPSSLPSWSAKIIGMEHLLVVVETARQLRIVA